MAKPLHFISRVKKDEGIYTVRLYAVPEITLQASKFYKGAVIKPGSMEWHWLHLGETGSGKTNEPLPIELPSLVKSFGSNHIQMENEFSIGAPEYKAKKITVRALPELAPLVTASRDFNQEIWCEITLEQWAVNCQPPKHGEFFWPRKKRLRFWGKLLRPQFTGEADTQALRTMYGSRQAMLRPEKRSEHIGELDLNFIHWIKVFGSQPVKPVLDFWGAIPGPYLTDQYISYSQFLWYLLQWMNPTLLSAYTDYRLKSFDNFECDVQLTTTLQGTVVKANRFARMFMLWVKPGAIGALFHWKANEIGEFSFYNKNGLMDLITTFLEEFHVKFQVEIPCLDEIATHLNPNNASNTEENRKANWQSVTRWLFLEIDRDAKDMAPRPKQDSMNYTPTATWIKKIKIDDPTPKDVHPSKAEYDNKREGGRDFSRKSLFRLLGKKWQWIAGAWSDADYSTDMDIYVNDPAETPDFEVARTATLDGNTFYDSWAAYQVAKIVSLWGGPRTIIKYTHRGVGIESFGANSPKHTPKPRGFGFMDVGDFRLLRRHLANVGLMYEGDTVGDFCAYDIEDEEGGDTKIAAIERYTFSPSGIGDDRTTDMPADPPPYDPPNYPPPNVAITAPSAGASVSGASVTISGTSSSSDSIPLGNVEIRLSGALIASVAVASGNWTYSWNSTTVPNGAYSIVARAHDVRGEFTEATRFITVAN